MMEILSQNIALIIFSFLSSFGLGIVFHIRKNDLIYAGIGGALTRCVYLLLLAATSNIFVQNILASMFAALYAEIMAMRQRMPSTVFLYPAVLPLIPGGTMYYIAVNLILGDQSATLSYTWNLLLSLAGICLGFVLVSTFTYYRRIYYFSTHTASLLRRGIRFIFIKLLRLDKKDGKWQRKAAGEGTGKEKDESNAAGTGGGEERKDR